MTILSLCRTTKAEIKKKNTTGTHRTVVFQLKNCAKLPENSVRARRLKIVLFKPTTIPFRADAEKPADFQGYELFTLQYLQKKEEYSEKKS